VTARPAARHAARWESATARPLVDADAETEAEKELGGGFVELAIPVPIPVSFQRKKPSAAEPSGEP